MNDLDSGRVFYFNLCQFSDQQRNRPHESVDNRLLMKWVAGLLLLLITARV